MMNEQILGRLKPPTPERLFTGAWSRYDRATSPSEWAGN